MPKTLRTITFDQEVQKQLSPDGVVSDIRPHGGIDTDAEAIQEAFPPVYTFHRPNGGGLAAVASMNKERLSPAAIAAELDRRFKTTDLYRAMAGNLHT